MGESGLLGENVCMGGIGGRDFPLRVTGTDVFTVVSKVPDGESELDRLACGCIWLHWHLNGDCAYVPARSRCCSSSELLRE